MAIPKYSDILREDRFQASPYDKRISVTNNYWDAYEKETGDVDYAKSQRELSLRRIDLKDESERADPVNRRVLNAEADEVSFALGATEALRRGELDQTGYQKALTAHEERRAQNKAQIDEVKPFFEQSKRKSEVRMAMAEGFQKSGVFGSVTAAAGGAVDKGIQRLPTGEWDLPILMQTTGNPILDTIGGATVALAQKTGARLDAGGMAIDKPKIRSSFDEIQKATGASDTEMQEAWMDISNSYRKMEDGEKARVLSDGTIVPNYNDSDWLNPEKAAKVVDSLPAPELSKELFKHSLKGMSGISQNIAHTKLEAYTTAAILNPVESPVDWAKKKGRMDDYGTPKFVEDYEKEVASQAGAGSKLLADYAQGGMKLISTGAGAAALASSFASDGLEFAGFDDGARRAGDFTTFAGKVGAEVSKVNQLSNQGMGDTPFYVGKVIEELPSLIAQAVTTKGIGAGATAAGFSKAAAGRIGMAGMLTTAGMQSAGMTYSQEIAAGASEDVARSKATKAGLNTALVTGMFQKLGMGGAESMMLGKGASGYAMRDLFATQSKKEFAKAMGRVGGGLGKAILGEGLEEGWDEFTAAFLNADPDTNLADAWANAVEAAKIGAVLGGGMGTISSIAETPTHLKGLNELERQANATSKSTAQENLPETEAAGRAFPTSGAVSLAEIERERAAQIADEQTTDEERAILEKATPEELAGEWGVDVAAEESQKPGAAKIEGASGEAKSPVAPASEPSTAPTKSQSPVAATEAPGGDGGISIPNIDNIISQGGGTVQISDNGRAVKYKQFGVALDGNTAEVAYVELDPSERGKGLGLKSYKALGEALAAKGITLQSSKAQYKEGRDMWVKLANQGLAKKGAQGVYYFTPPAAATPATDTSQTQKEISQNRNTDLFPDATDFGGKLESPAEISDYSENDGVGVAEYKNPKTGSTDVYIAAFGDNDFIAYTRQYVNGKPTNRFTSKLERRTERAGATKRMVTELQSRLPANHEYTEDQTVSTDGLRFFAKQLKNGYEVVVDANGKPTTTTDVDISAESMVNDLGDNITGSDNFGNAKVTSRKDFDQAKAAILPLLETFGLNESNIRWTGVSIQIDMPVLRRVSPTPAAATTPTPAPAAALAPKATLEGSDEATTTPTTEQPSAQNTPAAPQSEQKVAQTPKETKPETKPAQPAKAEEVKTDKAVFVKNAKSKIDEVINAPLEEETGATFNADGTIYEGGGLVVPGGSKNLTTATMSAEAVFDFMQENSAKMEVPGSVKFGIYKFPNSDQVSVDVNLVVDPSHREAAIALGKELGQESLFDLDTFENVKTGADGKNPRNLTDKEFNDAARRFSQPAQPAKAEEVKTDKKDLRNAPIEDIAKAVMENPDDVNAALLVFAAAGIRPASLPGQQTTTPAVEPNGQMQLFQDPESEGDQAAKDYIKSFKGVPPKGATRAILDYAGDPLLARGELGDLPASTVKEIQLADDLIQENTKGVNKGTKKQPFWVSTVKVGRIGMNNFLSTLWKHNNPEAKPGWINFRDEGSINNLSEILSFEVAHALTKDGSGKDWYKAKIEEMYAILTPQFPELGKDGKERFFFSIILAATSNGQDVLSNMEDAIRIYKGMRGKDNIPLKVKIKRSSRNGPVNNSILTARSLIREVGWEKAKAFMLEPITVSQLKKEYGIDLAGELAGHTVIGAMMMGPKIGSFWGNLNGHYDSVTMDLWFTRSMNRLSGDNSTLNHTKLAKAFEELAVLPGVPSNVRKEIKDYINAARKGEGEAWTKIASDIREEVDVLYDYLKSTMAAYSASGFAEDQRTDTNKKVKSIIGIIDGGEESPDNGSHRAWMRNVVEAAQVKLKKAGIDITNADLQAVLWFHEKDLYTRFGATSSRGGRMDYAQAADTAIKAGRMKKKLPVQGKAIVSQDQPFTLENEPPRKAKEALAAKEVREYEARMAAKRGETGTLNQDAAPKGTYTPKAVAAAQNVSNATLALIEGKSDTTTGVHEAGHAIEDFLTEIGEGDKAAALDAWARENVGDDWRKRREYIARGFERFVINGVKTGVESVDRAFARIAEIMLNIYKGVKGSSVDIDIPPHIEKIFNDLLSRGKQLEAEGKAPLTVPVDVKKQASKPKTESKPTPTPAPKPKIPARKMPVPKTTSVKNAETDKELVAAGFEPLYAPARKALQTSLDEALAKVDSDPMAGKKLVESLHRKPHAINDVGHGLLLDELAKSKLRTANAEKAIAKAAKDNDPDALKLAQDERTAALNDIARVVMAAKLAGTEWGRAGRFRQIRIDEDYSIEAMMSRFQADINEGKPINKEQEAFIRKLQKDLEAAEKERKAAEDALNEYEKKAAAIQEAAGKKLAKEKPARPRSALAEKALVVATSARDHLRAMGIGEVKLNQMAGERAQMPQFRRDSLESAKAMAAAGRSSEEIRAVTGWFPGKYDGKMRWEIPDGGAKLTAKWENLPAFGGFMGKPEYILLKDALNHPELFAAYPQLGDVWLSKQSGFFDFFGAVQGWFNPDTNSLNVTPNAQDPLSTLLHETQHWIQQREGFARGSNTESVMKGLSPAQKTAAVEKMQKKAADLIAKAEERLVASEDALNLANSIKASSFDAASSVYEKADSDFSAAIKEFGSGTPEVRAAYDVLGVAKKEKYMAAGLDPSPSMVLARFDLYMAVLDAESTSNLKSKAEAIRGEAREAILNHNELLLNASKSDEGFEAAVKAFDLSYHLYQNVAGEIESRDVQARASMTPEQLAAAAPYSSENIAEEDAIVLFQENENKLNQEGETNDTARFAELTKSLPANPTQADIDAFKAANPEAYAELKAMREKVLRAAGYSNKGFHGTTKRWTSYIFGKRATTAPDEGIYITDSAEEAAIAASPSREKAVVMDLFTKADNPLIIDAKGTEKGRSFGKAGYKKAIEIAKQQGRDSVVVKNVVDYGDVPQTTTILFSPEQIKSTEPLNTDSNGRLIPPSEWGDTGSPSILFQENENKLNQEGENNDTARFAELTASIPAKPTQADIDAWKAANPEAYAELKAMRERVLRAAGYDIGPIHHGTTGARGNFDIFKNGITAKDAFRLAFDGLGPAWFTSNLEQAEKFKGNRGGRVVTAHLKLEKPWTIFADEFAVAEHAERYRELQALKKKDRENSGNDTANGWFRDGLTFEERSRMKELYALGANEEITKGDSWEGLEKLRDEAKLQYPDLSDGEAVRKGLSDQGYDGIILEATTADGGFGADTRVGNMWVIPFGGGSQIKSTEPLNLSPDGRLIPPSEWGDTGSPSILYQEAPEEENTQVEVLDAISDVGLEYFANGAKTLEAFTEKVVAEFGEGFRNQIDDIFGLTQDKYKKLASTARQKTPQELASLIDPTKEISNRMVYNMALGFMRQGLKGDAVLDAVTKLLKNDYPDITREEVVIAFTGYGKIITPSQEQIKKDMRELRTVERLKAQLDDLAKGDLPKRTGLQRDKTTSPVRALMKQVEQAIRDSGLKHNDRKDRLAGSLDPIRTRLKNEIADMDQAIKTKTALNKTKKEPKTDAEIEKLKKQRDDMKKRYDAIFGIDAKKISVEAQIKKASKMLDRQIDRLEREARGEILNNPTKVKLDSPELKAKRERIEALREAKRVADEALNPKKTAAELATERLKASAEKSIEHYEYFIKNGTYPPKADGTPATMDDVMRDLLATRDSLRDTVREIQKDRRVLTPPEVIARNRAVRQLTKTIADLEARIAKRDFSKRAKKPESTDPEVRNLKATVASLRETLDQIEKDSLKPIDPEEKRTLRMIAASRLRRKKLLQKVKDKDYSKAVKRDPVKDARLARAVLKEKRVLATWNKKFFDAELAKRTKTKKVMDAVLAPVHAIRTVKTIGDVSAPHRQGLISSLAHPIRGARNYIKMWKAARPFGKGAENLAMQMREIENNKYYLASQRGDIKMFIAKTGEGATMEDLEEAFQGRLVDNIPILNGVKSFSERTYNAFLNGTRMDHFAAIANWVSGGDPNNLTREQASAIANYVNISTGRGNFGKLQNAAGALSLLFFSPKFLVSRFQWLTGLLISAVDTITLFKGYSPEMRGVRKAIALEYIRTLAGFTALYSLYVFGSLMYGGDEDDEEWKDVLSVNPLSSKGGRIKVGDTYLDVAGGLAQTLNHISRELVNKTVTGDEDTIKHLRNADYGKISYVKVVTNFVRTKLAPVPSAYVNLKEGTNVVGEKVTLRSEAISLVSMMIVNDAYETIQANGWGRGLFLTGLAAHGVGLSTRDDKLSLSQEAAILLGEDPAAFEKKKKKTDLNWIRF